MSQDNKNKNYIDIPLFYKSKKDNDVRILGEKFVENNKDKAKIIFN